MSRNLNIFIRVDASYEIGTGHVMRCLTYAMDRKKQGHFVSFICRKANGDCIDLIQQQGFKVYALKAVHDNLWKYTEKYWEKDAIETIQILKQFSVNQVVVDHYSLDEKWEKEVRPYTEKIMVIDDLANRKHDCDVLLDQNFYFDMNRRYEKLVPRHAKLLLGPKYALLRDEFKKARNKIKPFNGTIERIFIFFGGSDPTNETEKVLRAIRPLIEKYHFIVDVVVGNSNPNKEVVQHLCKEMGLNFYCQINNMAELMAKADLAIGAGGSTNWERAYLLLPSIVITIAKNQEEIAETLHQSGMIYYLGPSQKVSEQMIKEAVEKLNNNQYLINQITKKCSTLFE